MCNLSIRFNLSRLIRLLLAGHNLGALLCSQMVNFSSIGSLVDTPAEHARHFVYWC